MGWKTWSSIGKAKPPYHYFRPEKIADTLRNLGYLKGLSRAVSWREGLRSQKLICRK